MQQLIVGKLVNTDYLSVTDEKELKALLLISAKKFVDQGIIDNSKGALDKSEFDADSIFLEANGWVFLKPVSSKPIRMTDLIQFCYQEPEAIDYVQISLCGGK